MSDPQSPESSSPPQATPPPLPQKVLLFKLAWRLGFWFGLMQIFFLLLAFVLYFLSPGGPAPWSFFFALVAALLQTFSANFISKHRTGGRSLFAMATVFAVLCYLPTPFFILGLFNLGPLLLLIASSSPDAAPKAIADKPLESEATAPSSAPASPKEDLY